MTEEPLTCNRPITVCDNILHHYRKTVAEVKFLQKQLDSLRYYCHHENYDIYNWEIKNIQTLEEEE
tara:strand:- start:128 stop:325 length:198 start_codon:yes stop_codon:yes gene_type:complete